MRGKKHLTEVMNEFPSKSKKYKGKDIYYGFKAPETITSRTSLTRLATFFPGINMIVSTRHPIKRFESLYNFRVKASMRKKTGKRVDKWENAHPMARMPETEMLIGNCGFDCDDSNNQLRNYTTGCVTTLQYKSLCTEMAKFHVQLARLGFTPLNTTDELDLLQHVNKRYSVHNFI